MSDGRGITVKAECGRRSFDALDRLASMPNLVRASAAQQRRLIPAPAIALVAAVAMVGGGTASDAVAANDAPSRAPMVQVGVPFAGMPNEKREHWWRLPQTIRAGDLVSVAVDAYCDPNSVRTNSDIYFALAQPVDDFDAEAERNRVFNVPQNVQCGTPKRLILTYDGQTGPAFLVALFPDQPYTATMEAIVTRVNLGYPGATTLPQRTSITAFARYGDNTPAADGIKGGMAWRLVPKRGGPLPQFHILRGAVAWTRGGSLLLPLNFPSYTRGRKIQLRACIQQPPTTSLRCTLPDTARVRK